MKSDGVSTAFAIIMEEIGSVEEQLNQEGVNAFTKSKYDDAQRLSEAGKALGKFREKLEALRNEWSSGIDASTRQRVKVEPGYTIKPHSKSTKTILRITLPSGRVIQRPTAAQAMADTIEVFGIEKVRALRHQVSGVDLVSDSKHEKYGQTQVGNYYICTHSNTESKKQLLSKIAKELGQNIVVEVI
ncbi:hypothetical protein [Desulfofustis glycolicus]|uniref:Uncharacterized protein n=1 Tax=Desulfofustis glycolicus DSM 9705 TaxID=1121409 RepID=A0A1M5XC02_9BACT|nr:hypothetical protein [Desulfofustis glycolicus]SHH97306.1 hypothetical protein SAMN02745124_02935 [Desulfofustis glycolicus DSM 9705]